MNAHTKEISPEEIEDLRIEVRAVLAEEQLSQAAAAKESGVAYSTFAAWVAGTYEGRVAEKAQEIRRWLETRRGRKRTLAVLPKAPEFVGTPTANAIMETMAFSQAAPDFGVVVGAAGVGKTSAIGEYQRRASNVTVVTAEPTTRSPNNMLTAIADEMGVIERRSNKISASICARLKGAGALLVIDEAQHLSSEALDQLRTIHDKAQCGIVVAGNESVFARLQGGEARSAQFAQLHSRVGTRLIQNKPRARDIADLITAWRIAVDSEEGRLLKAIAQKPGALRAMTKTLRYAGMMAAGAGGEISAEHIRRAFAQLSSAGLDAAA